MPNTKIGLLGATGETGSSILNGLLEAGNFDIVALTRPSSLSKPSTLALQSRSNVTLRSCDLSGSQENLVASLQGLDVLVSAIGPLDQALQIPRATAAKSAGVKRFITCAFITIIAPGGTHLLRDHKELVYNHIKTIRLPYTVIDVGWWYQITVPALPSGKTDYMASLGDTEIAGSGDTLSALTDLRDIGRYVALIVADARTLNKYVFVYNELWSQNGIHDIFEKMSGEVIDRKYISEESLKKKIENASDDLKDWDALLAKVPAQYKMSWGIRGHNTPEYAAYLGYVTSKGLYPDFQYVKYEDFAKEVLDGKAKTVYDELKAKFAAMGAAK